MKRIAIVGAGIAGLVAANELKKKGYDITVFEKQSHSGGRIDTFEIEYHGTVYYQDWGAEYFIDKNDAIMNLVDELELEVEEYLARRSVLDLSDQSQLILPSSKDGFIKRIVRMFQLFSSFKGDAMKLNVLTKQFTEDISTLYELLDNYPIEEAFAQIKDTYQEYMNKTLDQFLLEEGMSQDTIDSFVNPLFRAVYMVDSSEINAFLGALAFAAKGSTIYHVKNGNSRIIDGLVRNLGDHIQYNSTIERIQENKEGSFELTSINNEGKTQVLSGFDMVFLSGPLRSLYDIDLQVSDKPTLPEDIPYHQAYHTIVRGVPSSAVKDLINQGVDTIFLTGKATKIWEMNVIATHEDEVLCDLTSRIPLADCDTSDILQGEYSIVGKKHWKQAYPFYSPEVIEIIPVNNQFTPTLFIGSDNIITSMDSSIRLAERFVALVELQKDTSKLSIQA